LALVASASHNGHLVGAGLHTIGEFLYSAALADPRLTYQEHQAAPPGDSLGQPMPEFSEFGFAADKGRMRQHQPALTAFAVGVRHHRLTGSVAKSNWFGIAHDTKAHDLLSSFNLLPMATSLRDLARKRGPLPT
jgi:hypothetical protein